MPEVPVNALSRRARRGERLRGAGYLIAASDSIKHHKDQAHTICTGVNDEARIQWAIDNIGGAIKILPGTYLPNRVPGQPYCILIDRSNIKIALDPGANLKLADAQYTSEEGHVFRLGVSGSTTIRSNVRIGGPGTIDGNRANQTLPGLPNMTCIQTLGRFEDLFIGGGLELANAGGAAMTTAASGGVSHRRWKYGDLYIHDCNEGILATGIIGMVINKLLIDTLLTQDGWEPLAVEDLVMSDSIIKRYVGSAVDLASNVATRNNRNHTYVNCIFGPANSASGRCVEIQIQAGGSTTDNITFSNCVLLAGNHAQGLRISGLSAAALAENINFNDCILDGTDSSPNSNGIEVAEFAKDVTFNNCTARGFGDNGMLINGDGVGANPTRISVQAGRYYNNDQDAQGGSGIAVEVNVGEVAISGPHCYDSQAVATQQNGVDVTNVGAAPVHVEVHDCVFRDNVNRGLEPVAPPAGVSATNNYGQA